MLMGRSRSLPTTELETFTQKEKEIKINGQYMTLDNLNGVLKILYCII
jgi:hypothetical protein